MEILKDKDGPVLLETSQPTGPGRFTHHASPNILVMSIATSDNNEEQAAPEPAVEADAEPEAEEPQGVEEKGKSRENTE